MYVSSMYGTVLSHCAMYENYSTASQIGSSSTFFAQQFPRNARISDVKCESNFITIEQFNLIEQFLTINRLVNRQFP